MPLSELPIELHEHVLDHLHDDPLSLRACSLTHTAWLPIARSHLFRTVRLDTARDCLRFLTTLDTTSESDGVGVGSLVRVLTLPAKMGFTELLHTRTVTRTRQARLRLDLLCQILRRVPNLETLDMTDFEWNCFADLICPQGAGVDLHDAVTVFAFPLLKVLVLRCFAVRSIQEIIQFIAAFPSVTTLELSGVWLYFHGFHYEPSDSIAYDQTISIRIRELIVGPLECTEPLLIGVSHALLNLTQGSQLRQLRWLFSPRVHDQEVFDKMFHGSASTLEVLEVDSLLVAGIATGPRRMVISTGPLPLPGTDYNRPVRANRPYTSIVGFCPGGHLEPCTEASAACGVYPSPSSGCPVQSGSAEPLASPDGLTHTVPDCLGHIMSLSVHCGWAEQPSGLGGQPQRCIARRARSRDAHRCGLHRTR
ncbi:uncharacterized protein C8Q71DRAFT_534585 [Rhodofomes roseus]|uniref:F-box domain-containing protein n=1 Tax=Rhodofomes roseus TaxID=34475 RepID=A0ABQ8KKS7_9APHY|nr:uncharacterized protein C8Q71DRAFT_534585 [Rhodofomes roseus]KAH9838528.1 hypothetical protein C8Q71DRAFT_534585 [Rhodofomes roseus]